MPPKPQHSNQPAAGKTYIELLALPLALLTLAAVSSPISQATLAPVFGAIPSAVNHKEAVVATSVLGLLLRALFRNVQRGRVAQCLAAWAFWVPVIQLYLFDYSKDLGPVYGPALIGFLSCHTIIIPSVYAATEALEALRLESQLGPYLAAILPGAMGVFHLISFERWFQTALPGLNMLSKIFTPVKMQMLVASTYSYLAPSKLCLLALPALIHTFLANPHFDSTQTMEVLDKSLRTHSWTILDRQWSNTGYVSVLESLDQQYRVMRCDHSLLGGEWLLTEERRSKEGWTVDEPIYSVFEMLESVRLMEVEPAIPDAHAKALVVGLGIGTAPKALLAHGINTTVVELDPVVHEYAMKYFGLPPNHTAVIRDAVFWVHETVTHNIERYDYIIHDVFTGGAEPLDLFTNTFLTNLRKLLRPNGAIALNYAGDLTTPLIAKVLNTIKEVFDAQCKLYRDTPSTPSSDSNSKDPASDKAAINEDFTNIIVFCRNNPGPISFRQPTEADFLGSKSREHYMYPDPKLGIPFPPIPAGEEAGVLNQADVGRWSRQQAESATKHWHIMRKVVPDIVWELW